MMNDLVQQKCLKTQSKALTDLDSHAKIQVERRGETLSTLKIFGIRHAKVVNLFTPMIGLPFVCTTQVFKSFLLLQVIREWYKYERLIPKNFGV
jgi:hypothetical protein